MTFSDIRVRQALRLVLDRETVVNSAFAGEAVAGNNLYGRLEHTIESDSGESLMAIAVNRGIPGIIAECGGNTACATCHVYLDEISFAALPPIAEHEEAMLDFTNSERRPTCRLSCQVLLTPAIDGAVIHVASN